MGGLGLRNELLGSKPVRVLAATGRAVWRGCGALRHVQAHYYAGLAHREDGGVGARFLDCTQRVLHRVSSVLHRLTGTLLCTVHCAQPGGGSWCRAA